VEAERKVTEALAEAKALQKSLDDKIKATDALRVEVEKLKAEHEALKASLIAKHKRHLQELEA
jgi:regulator of replication initiation timing